MALFYATIKPYTPYRCTSMLLLSTSSLTGHGLHRIFQFAKEAGYTGLDIALWSINYDLWDEEYIDSLTKEFWLPILSITAPSRGMSQKKFEKIVTMAKFLKVQSITFSPPHFRDKDTKWFGSGLVKVKRDTHISVCVQNVETKMVLFLIPEYRNATLTQIKSMTWDSALDLLAVDGSSSMDIIKAQKILGSSLKNIYFSDRYGMKKWILPWGAGAGTSHLPLESFLMKLKSNGYGGFITLKVSPKEIGVWNNDRLKQNLEYMKKYYDKHFAKFTSQ